MSDSGRQIGDCRHGRSAGRCVECLRAEVARLEARGGKVMAGFQTEFFVAVELVGRGEGGAAEPSGWSLAFRRACELPFPPARGVAWRFCVCCDALELPYDDVGQALVYDPGREAFEVRLHAEWACRGALADGARAARTHYLSSGWASDPGADNMPREGEPF